MASLRSLASCIGVTGEFSVVRDFFGYASPPPWVLAPNIQKIDLPSSLSLLTQIRRLQQPYFNINVVRVGTNSDGLFAPEGEDNIDAAVDEQNVDCAVDMAREIYGAIGVGIGRVERWWRIPAADTDYEVITSRAEAGDLVQEFSVGNDGIDVFVVLVWVGDIAGRHPLRGDGVMLESLQTDFLGTARTFSHELGHYFLGQGHKNNEPNNLMAQTDNANPMPGSTQLNAHQAEKIKKHDKILDAC
jgi:hypothetical protein